MIRFRRATVAAAAGFLAISCAKNEANAPAEVGSLTATVTGLPAGQDAAVTITGPGNFERAVASTTTLTDLTPGTYVVSASDVTSDGHLYTPDRASHVVTVVAGGPATQADVVYAIATGGLEISIAGMPPGESAAVDVSGPGGFTQTVTQTDTLVGLAPGTYSVAAAEVIVGGQTYWGAPDTQSIPVVVGLAPATATVQYALASGDLGITISGLPPATDALVSVTGPSDFSRLLSTADTLSGLLVGTYTVAAVEVSSNGHVFGSGTGPDTVEVTPGAQANVNVLYTQITGTLNVSITGLPPAVDAIVTVNGPDDFTTTLTASDSLVGVVGGTYEISAAFVADGTDGYTPNPTTQNVIVLPEATAQAAVAYSFSGVITLNFTIDGLYIVQSAQRYDGTVPLVEGRDAYLRVFAKANLDNTNTPQVHVRLYHSGTAVDSFLIDAGGTAVPTTINEGETTASWNVPIPGSLVQSGLSILAEVDPNDDVVEMDESDNVYPVDGVPGNIEVRSLPPLAVRFIPVYSPVTNDTGNVDAGNTDQFMDQTVRMFPAAVYDVDVGSVYTTSAEILMNDNDNGAWGTVLSEIRTLRNVTDQSDRYYYGIVRAPYNSGVAGIGYVPGSPTSTSKAAVGWDYLPSGSGVMAHELGHNFGRLHAPCGNPGGPDPDYPYSEASIGVWGMDVASLAMKSPGTNKDLMSYCSPEWISDYTYEAVFDWRDASPTGQPPASMRSGRTLLVWGRITDNSIVLEPAFELDAPAILPETPGPYQVEALASDGSTVFGLSFAGDLVADAPGGPERHFSFLVPLSETDVSRLETIRVSGRGMVASRTAATAAAGTAVVRGMRAEAVRAERTDLAWDAARHPMVLVRDPATGDILSFARGGSSRILTSRPDLDVIVSDGVRSTAQRIAVRGR